MLVLNALTGAAFAPDAQPAPVAGAFAAAIDTAAALPPDEGLSCHARDHYDLSGDAAFVWGMGFRVKDGAECCAACAAHRRLCGRNRSRGSVFWKTSQGRSHTCSSGRRNVCNAWVFCAGDPSAPPEYANRCFSYDVHNHTRGECWLKHESNPASPVAAGPTLPRAMREAPRKQWPWAVSEKLWPWPVPEYLTWQSGVVAPSGATTWQAVGVPGWHRRFCKRHGPC